MSTDPTTLKGSDPITDLHGPTSQLDSSQACRDQIFEKDENGPDQARMLLAKSMRTVMGKSPDFWQALSSCVATVLTIILAIVAYWQWNAMESQNKIAQKSAEAAVKATAIAQDTLESTQRAYLSVGKPEEMLGGWGLIRMPLENYGHAPARVSLIKLNYLRIASLPNPTQLEDRVTYVKDKLPVVTPGPVGATIVIGMPNYPPEQALAIGSGQHSLLIRGVLEYQTGFGAKTDNVLFCLHYRATKKGWVSCGGESISIDLGEAPHRKLQQFPQN